MRSQQRLRNGDFHVSPNVDSKNMNECALLGRGEPKEPPGGGGGGGPPPLFSWPNCLGNICCHDVGRKSLLGVLLRSIPVDDQRNRLGNGAIPYRVKGGAD
jgi:hypothetical protein